MTIEAETIERIYNVSASSAPKAYQLCLFQLRSEIERHTTLLCCQQGETLRIMTDAEAEQHSFKEGKRGVRKIARQVERRARIDYSVLTDGQRRTAETRDSVLTWIAIFGRRELKRALCHCQAQPVRHQGGHRGRQLLGIGQPKTDKVT